MSFKYKDQVPYLVNIYRNKSLNDIDEKYLHKNIVEAIVDILINKNDSEKVINDNSLPLDFKIKRR